MIVRCEMEAVVFPSCHAVPAQQPRRGTVVADARKQTKTDQWLVVTVEWTADIVSVMAVRWRRDSRRCTLRRHCCHSNQPSSSCLAFIRICLAFSPRAYSDRQLTRTQLKRLPLVVCELTKDKTIENGTVLSRQLTFRSSRLSRRTNCLLSSQYTGTLSQHSRQFGYAFTLVCLFVCLSVCHGGEMTLKQLLLWTNFRNKKQSARFWFHIAVCRLRPLRTDLNRNCPVAGKSWDYPQPSNINVCNACFELFIQRQKPLATHECVYWTASTVVYCLRYCYLCIYNCFKLKLQQI